MSPRPLVMRAAALVGGAALSLSVVGALPAPATAAAPDDGCEDFVAGYRTTRILDDLAITHTAVRYVPPTSSSKGRMRLSEIQEVKARALIDGHRAPKVGPALTRRAERRLDLDLVPVGSTSHDTPATLRFSIRNRTDRNQAWVLYRGTTSYWARVQRSSCEDGAVTWRRAGQWSAYVPMSKGVLLCGTTGATPLEQAALDGAC